MDDSAVDNSNGYDDCIRHILYFIHLTIITFFLTFIYFTSLREQDEAYISTPHDGRLWWASNLRTSACESPALPLCDRRRQ